MLMRASFFAIAALLATGSAFAETRAVPPPSLDDYLQPVAVNAEPLMFRQQATEGVESGTVMRAEGVATATPGPRIAGYLARPDTERPLSAEALAELLALLRSDSGFDDSIVERCRPGLSIGVKLTRTAAPATELVLDFECERMILTGPPGSGEQATDFGPSRDAFVAFAKHALPDDAEVQALP